MNNAPLMRLAGALIFASFTLSGPIANGHPCERDNSPNHKHCSGDGGSNLGDRIPGTATINGGGTITSDGGGPYGDGVESRDFQNNPYLMQVAMGCQASNNNFNFNPGGGGLNPGGGAAADGRRIRIDFKVGFEAITTAITSCDVPDTPDDTIVVSNTDMLGPDCVGTDPDWGFDQLLRVTPNDGQNVCELLDGQSLTATARLQTNLFHLNDCKGGKKKCGLNREGIDINYDSTDGLSADVTITCTAGTGVNPGPCTEWHIGSDGPGRLEQESGGTGVQGDFPIDIDFVAD